MVSLIFIAQTFQDQDRFVNRWRNFVRSGREQCRGARGGAKCRGLLRRLSRYRSVLLEQGLDVAKKGGYLAFDHTPNERVINEVVAVD